ncbi:MAG: hypothetical protein ACPGJS_15785 [Flammeovirgaceae bacterium]
MMDKMFTIMCLLFFSTNISAQENPLAKEKWQYFFKQSNFAENMHVVEQRLQSGHWHDGLLVYKDGTAQETALLFTSFPHFSMPNGRLKTTHLGEISKKELKCFVVNDYLWMPKNGKWGIVQVTGPLTLFSTFSSAGNEFYIIDEQNNWISERDLATNFKKKMLPLIGDHATLSSKIREKEKAYRFTAENLVRIVHEYNEWVKINAPDRYKQSVYLMANK